MHMFVHHIQTIASYLDVKHANLLNKIDPIRKTHHQHETDAYLEALIICFRSV